MSEETLADRLDTDANTLSLECRECTQTFIVDGSRRHEDCPNCFGSRTDVFV